MNENTSPEGVFDPAIEQVNKIMAGPMNFYNAERVENEIDLIAEVRQRMVSVGLADRLPGCFDSNRFILEAQGKPAHAQQYNLNRYFTTQFMAVPEDTHCSAMRRFMRFVLISGWISLTTRFCQVW